MLSELSGWYSFRTKSTQQLPEPNTLVPQVFDLTYGSKYIGFHIALFVMIGLISVCSFYKTSPYLKHFLDFNSVRLLHGHFSKHNARGLCYSLFLLLRTLEILGVFESPVVRVPIIVSQESLVISEYSLCGKHDKPHVRKKDEARSVAFQRTSRGQLSAQYRTNCKEE